MTSSSAQADDSPYCRKVRARGAADAALLEAPSFLAEGIKAPSPVQPGAKVDATTAYQIRAGISFSPLDFYKGTRVSAVADADCEQHQTMLTAQEILLHAPDLGRLGALRDQAAYIDAQRSVWEGTATRMTERFVTQNATLVELEMIRSQSSAIARQRAQVAGEIARIEASGLADYRGSIPGLLRDIREKTMKFEHEVSHVRSLDAWKLNLTGGYLPPLYGTGSGDYFGVIQVGYNLGGPWHNGAETRYLAARDEELVKSRQEMGRQLQILTDSVKVASAQAERELAVVEKRIAEMTALRATVATSDASAAPFAQARLDIELVAAQADRVFLTGLIREFSRLELN